ncbi:hypothetical protein HU200_032930 [Digitaria exilis]|uniref:Uncharacterized protein n=1 Tax=Digitaria exilis TaxID=1010633 RepID=A0A835BNH8_9POAL|nr:hypothetical protein HU200_032930 [Digitaria exilis]
MDPAQKLPGHGHIEQAVGARRAAPWSWLAGLVAVGLGGAALLVWWALAFHPANARLWMVPAGLVLLGTPILAWFSVLASGPTSPGAGAYASA